MAHAPIIYPIPLPTSGLQKFQEQHFPLVITDINMPGMNGLELVDRIKTLDPDVQVIATSANRETECLVAAADSASI